MAFKIFLGMLIFFRGEIWWILSKLIHVEWFFAPVYHGKLFSSSSPSPLHVLQSTRIGDDVKVIGLMLLTINLTKLLELKLNERISKRNFVFAEIEAGGFSFSLEDFL